MVSWGLLSWLGFIMCKCLVFRLKLLHVKFMLKNFGVYCRGIFLWIKIIICKKIIKQDFGIFMCLKIMLCKKFWCLREYVELRLFESETPRTQT